MMRKLALNLEALAVESFDTSPARHSARGTVEGHSDDGYSEYYCPSISCPTQRYENTCDGTCHATCKPLICWPLQTL